MKPSPIVVAAMASMAFSAYVPPEAQYGARLLMRKPKTSKYPSKGPPAKPTQAIETRQSRRRKAREDAKKNGGK